VKQQMAKLLRQPVECLADEARLIDVVADSLVLVETVIELQEHFGVRLVQDDVRSVVTVGELARLFSGERRSSTSCP